MFRRRSSSDLVAIRDVRATERPHYGLTLVCGLKRSLSLRVLYDPTRFDPEAMERLVEHFGELLQGLLCEWTYEALQSACRDLCGRSCPRRSMERHTA